MKLRFSLLLTISAALFAGCNNGGGATVPPPASESSTSYNSLAELALNVECSGYIEGAVYFIASENVNYVCGRDAYGNWAWLVQRPLVPDYGENQDYCSMNPAACVDNGSTPSQQTNPGGNQPNGGTYLSSASGNPPVSDNTSGSQWPIKGTMIDSRDGHVYNTVKMPDGKVWMADNLSFATENSWCYDNLPANCSKYGRLYTWSAALDSAGVFSMTTAGCGVNFGADCIMAKFVQGELLRTYARGICPEKWHLPTSDEWERLIGAVYDDRKAALMSGLIPVATYLKSTSGWDMLCDDCVGNGNDFYGFNVRPSGWYTGDERPPQDIEFQQEWEGAFFWTVESCMYCANYRDESYIAEFSNDDRQVTISTTYNDFAMSVRCVQD